MDPSDRPPVAAARHKLGVVSGVYIPVCLNIISILMFLRFGSILGHVGLLGMLSLLVAAYVINLLTALSLSAIASNGEVRGGGAYYLISRSLGPEFGGSIGLLFYLSQVLNTALNVVGLVDCLRLAAEARGTDGGGLVLNYGLQSAALAACTLLCLAGSATFSRASNALLVVLCVAVLSIPLSAVMQAPFVDPRAGVEFTGLSTDTLASNFYPAPRRAGFRGFATFRALFGILFPATSGIFAGASMSGDLESPGRAIPKGTLWATATTFVIYVVVVVSLAATATRGSLLAAPDIIAATNLSPPVILAGECAVTFFSALMGIVGAAKLLQAMGRDRLVPGLGVFGTAGEPPYLAVALTYVLAQLSLAANLDQIATLISMGYQMTFLVMNLACFLLTIASAPNFRPGFKLFSWPAAFLGSVLSALAMVFISAAHAASAASALVVLFLLIHYLCPPKRWGDVSQNLIYHQVRKYLLRLRSSEHVKFWRPQILLLVNSPRRHMQLVRFCNSMKKGGLYVLGHAIVTDDFSEGAREAKRQQTAWEGYISEYSRIKAFVQLTVAPSVTWGVRNLVLSAGLGGMRPNIAVIGFYNGSPDGRSSFPQEESLQQAAAAAAAASQADGAAWTYRPRRRRRRRGDLVSHLMGSALPTDAIRPEDGMTATEYMTIVEDLALHYRLNVAVAKGFETLEKASGGEKQWIDLWPIQMSAEVTADGKNLLTTNFDTYTLILQLGYVLSSVPSWKRSHRPRVLVFVEYESEVEEERARVRALLDKLRIEAEVLVFWLACGTLKTYELIVNGRGDPETDARTDAVLRGEDWWDGLRAWRGERPGSGGRRRGQTQTREQSQRQSSAATMIRIPRHALESDGHSSPTPPPAPRRRSSAIEEIPRTASVVGLSRLGVSIGIHTQHLDDGMLREVDDAGDDTTDDEELALPEAVHSQDSWVDAAASESEEEGRPLLLRGDSSEDEGAVLYGTMEDPRNRSVSRETTLHVSRLRPRPAGGQKQVTSPNAPGLAMPDDDDDDDLPLAIRASSTSTETPIPIAPVRPQNPPSPVLPTPAFARPPLSRQSSALRFSSRPMPEARVGDADGDAGPTIMFAEEQGESSTAVRPALSRQSSTGRFSNFRGRTATDGAADMGNIPSPIPQSEKSDGSSSLPLLPTAPPGALRGMWSAPDDGDDEGWLPSPHSSYSAQHVPLSFNDLPSTAQHLILNELMRRHSGAGEDSRTGVVLTTLPVPAEGVGKDEDAARKWLRGVEVLCEGMGPVMMVLSNSLSVTVSL